MDIIRPIIQIIAGVAGSVIIAAVGVFEPTNLKQNLKK